MNALLPWSSSKFEVSVLTERFISLNRHKSFQILNNLRALDNQNESIRFDLLENLKMVDLDGNRITYVQKLFFF